MSVTHGQNRRRRLWGRSGFVLASLLACCLLAGPLSVIFPQAADAATVSDSFDRANGALGSNWTTTPGTAAPQISGNTLHAGTASSLNSAYWSASTFGSDQFSQGTLPASSGGNYGPGLAVRLSGTKGYFLWYGNSGNTVSLWRMDSASSWTQLKASSTLTVTPATDVWKIQVVGSTISGYQNGNLVVQTTDTSITSGSPGVWLYYAANQIDNWSGGDATAAPTTYSVGGAASGLASGGTVVLQNNGGNDLTVAANGTFAFSTALTTGAAYSVTVKTNPAGQTCTVANGTGTVGTANVTTVAVTCKTNPAYTVGGTASGLASGSTVVLQNNGGNNLSVTANGTFTFSTALAPGAAYSVAVSSNPPGQTCAVANGSGTIGAANVTSVAVTCTTTPVTHTVGGTLSGLASGGTAVLQDNGGNDLSVTANGGFTFSTAVASGAPYSVTVKTSPTGQTCTVANGTGTVGSANVTSVAVTCTTAGGGGGGGTGGTTVSDSFDRANGGLGSNWTTVPGTAAPQISGNTARAGTANALNSAYWSANTFGSDQFAQGTLPASSGGTDGPGLAVRLSAAKGYFLWYGNATNTVSLWRMDSATSWTQLKASGTLTIAPATDVWKIQVVGSTITGYQNGTQVIQATDTSITSGSPGIWLYYAANQIDNWSGGNATTSPGSYTVGGTVSGLASGATMVLEDNGGNDLGVTANGAFTFSTALATGAAYAVTVKTSPAGQSCAVGSGTGTVGSANVTNVAVTCTTAGGGGSGGTGGLQVTYTGTDANGVQSYSMLSSEDGGTTEVLRVLPPSNPAAGVKHNFLFMLPVESGQGSTYGDGIATAAAANAQNQYNLTIIEPAFPTDPWYADNPANTNVQYESFMTTQLVPWVKANLSITGTEQNWLIGFSKSGFGGQDLLLKHPDLFSVAASWDFPADMSSYDGADPYGTVGGGSAANYGTDANFQAGYRLSSSFLSAHAAPFTSANRIWIGGYGVFQPEMADYDALLTQLGIRHTTETPTYMAHRWDSGWVPQALAALETDSQALG
jgi:hypothetical protein